MTYLEKINGEYPNLPSMETRVLELTQELKDISAASGSNYIIYKLRWDERASLKREINALKANCGSKKMYLDDYLGQTPNS